MRQATAALAMIKLERPVSPAIGSDVARFTRYRGRVPGAVCPLRAVAVTNRARALRNGFRLVENLYRDGPTMT